MGELKFNEIVELLNLIGTKTANTADSICGALISFGRKVEELIDEINENKPLYQKEFEKINFNWDKLKYFNNKSNFTYGELLALWDGLNKLPQKSIVTYGDEKNNIEYLKIKVQLLAEEQQ